MYDFKHSDALFRRAARVIPRGIYGTKGPALVQAGSYPLFATRGEGCRYWDADGNEFIDYLCGFGANVLGHRHPRVEQAVADALARGLAFNHPTEAFVALAEKMTELIQGMDWAIFGKNGSDATTLALQVARAHTRRPKVLTARGAYHGSHPWNTHGRGGLVPEDKAHTHHFRFNDVADLTAQLEHHRNEVAAVMVTPYHHPAFGDSEFGTDQFWSSLAELSQAQGFLVISDDIRVGFRASINGSHSALGFQPDLTCYSKAIANGYPISMCLGSQASRQAADSLFCTGTFWMQEYPMVAALACLAELEDSDAIPRMRRLGEQLVAGLHDVAARHEQRLHITGLPTMPYVRFANEGDYLRSQLFCAEATRRGAYFHPHHNWFLSAAHDEAAIAATLTIADAAMGEVHRSFGAAPASGAAVVLGSETGR